ncbi:MAG: hypothetical protein ABSH51_23900 [Solirubrobacteraceae bacterium]|jgi:hypothetical protein
MSNPAHTEQLAGHHLRLAIEDAGRLVDARPTHYTAAWSAKAAQVGDLSVLLLALRD